MQLKKLYFILVLISSILLQNCSSDNEPKSIEGLIEEVPVYDSNEYDSVAIQGKVKLLLPAYFSLIELNEEPLLIKANHISREEHFKLIETSKKKFVSYSSEIEEKYTSDSMFLLFASQELSKLRSILKSESSFEITRKSIVNDMNSVSYEIEGSSFGFPIEQIFFIRFYEGKNNYYSLISWTVKSSKSEFEDVAKIMQLTLKEI